MSEFRSLQLDSHGFPIPPESFLLDETGQETGVDSGGDGVIIVIPWLQRARLARVTVEDTTGGGPDGFRIRVLSKNEAPPNGLSIMFESNTTQILIDEVVNLPFKNIDNDPPRDEAYLQIIPTAGTGKAYNWRLIGTGMA